MPTPRFTVPSPDKLVNPATDTDPASVAQWIDHLPYADPVSTVKSVRQALARLNRHPADISCRADIMAHYRLPCARLLKVRADAAQAPNHADLRQLMTEMAHGYKHLANEWLGQRAWLQNRKRLTTALYFAAKYLSLELFLGYEAYYCKPSNSWRELLSLYRLAEEQNLHHEPVQDRDQGNAQQTSIAHALKRIILLRLLDPCHMLPGEARIYFGYLNQLASEALLENLDQPHALAGRYLLDLNSNAMPKPPDPDILPQNPDRFRYLNLLPVSKQVHQQIKRLELRDESPPEDLLRDRQLDPITLLKRMLIAWHGRQERRCERETTFDWLLCGYGLGAMQFFQQQQTQEISVSEVVEEDIIADTAQSFSPQTQSAVYTLIRCRQINRSASGLCLHLARSSNLKPQVGQVVILQRETAQPADGAQAGIIRRMLCVDADTLEAGIQFIRGTTHPIMVRTAGEQGSAQPALWIDGGDGRNSTLMVALAMYQRSQKFIIEGGLPAAVVAVEKLVECTPNFARFLYRIESA
jgi:hypothetical protein